MSTLDCANPPGEPARLVKVLLSDSLGGFPSWLPSTVTTERLSPLQFGAAIGVGYLLLFWACPMLVERVSSGGWPHLSDPHFLLAVWASTYITFAVTTARSTSAAVMTIIERHILPFLSITTASTIGEEVQRRFSPWRLDITSVTVATVAVFASVGALYHDQALNKWSDKYPYALFAWFLLGYFFLFFTAARVTDATRFYEILAEALSMERAQICPPDPSHSAIVMRVASIGRRILLFWLGIAFSVLTMLIFLPPFPHFAGAVVAIASFFSIGLGTIVFLRSEMHIASAVYDVIISTLRDTEAEIMRLGGSLASLTSDGSERLKELVEFHKELSTTGGYRNVVLTSMSILAPLLGPVMTFLLSKGFAPLAALVRWNIFSSH